MPEMIRASDVNKLQRAMAASGLAYERWFAKLPTVPAIELEKIREVVAELKRPLSNDMTRDYLQYDKGYNHALSDIQDAIGEKQ